MTLHFYMLRVNASDPDEAREKIIEELRRDGLQPAEPPRPFEAQVKYGDGPLWECVARVQGAA